MLKLTNQTRKAVSDIANPVPNLLKVCIGNETQKQLAAAQEELHTTKQRLEKLTVDADAQQRQLREEISVAKVPSFVHRICRAK